MQIQVHEKSVLKILWNSTTCQLTILSNLDQVVLLKKSLNLWCVKPKGRAEFLVSVINFRISDVNAYTVSLEIELSGPCTVPLKIKLAPLRPGHVDIRYDDILTSVRTTVPRVTTKVRAGRKFSLALTDSSKLRNSGCLSRSQLSFFSPG